MMPSPRHVLLLEDDRDDALLIGRAVNKIYPDAAVEHITSREQLLSRLDDGPVDVVLSDSTVPGCEGLRGFHLARDRHPHVPFIYVSGSTDQERDVVGLKALGAAAFLCKDDLSRLGPAIESALVERDRSRRSIGLMAGYEYLVGVIAELSAAHDHPAIMKIARRAARELTGADGSAVILRDGDTCLYADEDSVNPLWLGQRLPMSKCLSGWAMTHRQPAVVRDVRLDVRVHPADHEGTFVRAVVIVPIQAIDPVGAIGTYWAEPREPYPQEVRLLQALADSVGVAMNNARGHQELESRVRERTSELEAFTYAVSQGLQAPMRHVRAATQVLADGHARPDSRHVRQAVDRIVLETERMEKMLDGLVALSQSSRFSVCREPVDMAALARELVGERRFAGERTGILDCPATLEVLGDERLIRQVLRNLIENAFKFSDTQPKPRVELGVISGAPPVYFVRDNGVGFDDTAADNLFDLFHRLSSSDEYPGTGVGLSIAQRVIHKHGGRIWARSRPGMGATFYFTLGR